MNDKNRTIDSCPSDDQFAAMSADEILGPPSAPVEHISARYPVCFRIDPEELLAEFGITALHTELDEDPHDEHEECWIDLDNRRVVYGPGCSCIVLAHAGGEFRTEVLVPQNAPRRREETCAEHGTSLVGAPEDWRRPKGPVPDAPGSTAWGRE